MAIARHLPKPSRRPADVVDRRATSLMTEDAELRTALFRFVDVVPACHGLDDLARHLTAFAEEIETAPASVRMLERAGKQKSGRMAIGAAALAAVRRMAHRFIAGETVSEATGVMRGLWSSDVATSVDLLGEATITTAEADRYARRCHEALEQLAAVYADLPARPEIEADGLGPIPRANLSVKVSALTPLLRPEAPELGKRDADARLRELLRTAHSLGAHLHIDMESYDSREAITDLVLETLADPEFRDGPSAGVVLQAYLRDSPALCERFIDFAGTTRRAHPLVVRLVKGAYWDHEVVEATQHGWAPPVFEVKAESDRNFEVLTGRMLEARASGVALRPAIASHNLRSVAHAVAVTRELGLGDADLELQVLRGLGDELQQALSASGLRVRTYCPVGDLVSGMAYLVRRLLENTSNEGVLQAQAAGTDLQELLRAP